MDPSEELTPDTERALPHVQLNDEQTYAVQFYCNKHGCSPEAALAHAVDLLAAEIDDDCVALLAQAMRRRAEAN